MVATSIRRGTLDSRSGSAESSAAHMMGSAAFFAPEMRTSPSSGRPPVMRSLSTPRRLLGGQRLHRQRVDLGAHAAAERAVNQLVALHARLAGEGARHHQRLEMLAVAAHLDALAGEPGLDAAFHAFRGHHQERSLYPVFSSHKLRPETTARLAATIARLAPGGKSDTPKNP